MFKRFSREFTVSNSRTDKASGKVHLHGLLGQSTVCVSFMKRFGGVTFNNGLYRIHVIAELENWTRIVCSAFPDFRNRIQCFSYDWLGRHFALDDARRQKNEPLILMLDVGAGEVLEIPATFAAFHEDELVNYRDAALAEEFFKRWQQANRSLLSPTQCVGYRRPLFLGGLDTLENHEIADMDVYWTITGQLLNQSR